MKLIQQYQVAAGLVKLGACRSIKAKSISGTVRVTLDGEQITLASGDVFVCPLGMNFSQVDVFAANEATGVILYGLVDFGGSGGGTATDDFILVRAYSDPNVEGLVPPNPDSPAQFFGSGPTHYVWNVDTQTWDGIII